MDIFNTREHFNSFTGDKGMFERLVRLACIDENKIDYIKIVDNVPEFDNNMKFDKIIMNPPYNRNLHLKVLAEAIEHLSDNGECVSLQPTIWLAKSNVNRPIAKYRKVFNGKINDIELVPHNIANILFGTGNSIEELGIYVLKQNVKTTIDLINYGFKDDTEKNLYNKIDMMNDDKGIITFNKCKYNDNYGSVAGIRKPHDVVIYTWHYGTNCTDAVIRKDDKKVSAVLYFNSENEKHNFLKSLNTTFMNWYWRMFVVTGDNKIINYMFRMADYSQPWTDERFYKFFNITPEEQKLIEETMEKYK